MITDCKIHTCFFSLKQAFSGWIAIGMQVYKSDVPMLPLNTDQCRNTTVIGTTVLNGTALHNMSTSMNMPEKNDIAPNYELVPRRFYMTGYSFVSFNPVVKSYQNASKNSCEEQRGDIRPSQLCPFYLNTIRQNVKIFIFSVSYSIYCSLVKSTFFYYNKTL